MSELFVSVEGLDGAGTTTLVQGIAERRPEYVTTAEPTGTPLGKQIRSNLRDTSDPVLDLLLFVADRREHLVEEIEPALESGSTVVTDRYVDSTRAYQPISLVEETADDVFFSELQAKNYIEWLHGYWHREPDLTLYIDVPVDTALDRSSLDEKYENKQFLAQARQNYHALAEFKDRIVTIDGTQSAEAVLDESLDVIDSHE